MSAKLRSNQSRANTLNHLKTLNQGQGLHTSRLKIKEVFGNKRSQNSVSWNVKPPETTDTSGHLNLDSNPGPGPGFPSWMGRHRKRLLAPAWTKWMRFHWKLQCSLAFQWGQRAVIVVVAKVQEVPPGRSGAFPEEPQGCCKKLSRLILEKKDLFQEKTIWYIINVVYVWLYDIMTVGYHLANKNVANENSLNFLNFSTIYTIYIHTYITLHYITLIEGSLEAKLPTIWTDEKQSREEAERRERLEERRSEEKESEERRCRCAKR